LPRALQGRLLTSPLLPAPTRQNSPAQERLDEDVNTVLKRFEIGPKVADKLVAKLERTTDLTKYDLANALTSYATHELRTRPLAREKYEDMARRVMVAPTIPPIRRSETVN
jgi:hypothetical protein